MEDTAADFAVGASIGLFGWFFGGLDGFFKVLLTFAIIDYFSGLSVAAWVKHNISSTIGFKGITKKCLMFSFVGIAHILDKYLLGGTRALRTAVCLFYIGNEGISIIENADLLGVPFPKILKDKFLGMKEHRSDDKKPTRRKHSKHDSKDGDASSEDGGEE
ncbi:MAG: phage holin family protein [Synergistaceae bacterium]|nr:phage holin family protein [Synergistaceae bacterium]